MLLKDEQNLIIKQCVVYITFLLIFLFIIISFKPKPTIQGRMACWGSRDTHRRAEYGVPLRDGALLAMGGAGGQRINILGGLWWGSQDRTFVCGTEDTLSFWEQTWGRNQGDAQHWDLESHEEGAAKPGGPRGTAPLLHPEPQVSGQKEAQPFLGQPALGSR